MENEPLGQPRGTVRAYLALFIVAAFVLATLSGVAAALFRGDTDLALALIAAIGVEAATVIGFYFGSRPPAS